MADISQIKLPNGDIFDLVDGSKSTATNWVNGSQEGSVRTINSAVEDSSYTIGHGAVAEGNSTKATGNYSHAEGGGTTASGDYSHAEGGGATASGNYSHTEGSMTTASGVFSHTEGNYTIASGYFSHVEGWSTIANHAYQHVFGQCNIEDPSTAYSSSKGTYVEIVGNGTSTSARANARTLDWSGNEVLAGKLTVGAVGVNSMDVATVGQIPNVPSWAMASTKPTYTANEVGALPANTVIPSKTSELINDSGFITTDSDEKVKQISESDNANALPILFSRSTDNSTVIGDVGKTSTFYIKPYYGLLHASRMHTKSLFISQDSSFSTGSNNYIQITQLESTLNDRYEVKLQSKSGTLALTSDIPDVSGFISDDKTWNGVTLDTTLINMSNNSCRIPFMWDTNDETSARMIRATKTPTNNEIALYDDNAYLKSTTPSANDNSTKVATTQYVDSAISIASKPALIGDTSTVTPTQVYEALQEGRDVVITHNDADYGNIKAYHFNYSATLNAVVSSSLVSYFGWRGISLLGELGTNDSGGTWSLDTTALATMADIPAVTDEKLAISTANTGTAYYPILGNGTTAQTRQYTSNLEVVNAPGSTGAGYTRLTIGNTAVSNGARGWIRLTTGQNQHYIDIFSGQEMQNNTTVYFPKTSGTLALTSDIPSTIVTSIATGIGLTGGTITTSGTIKANLNSETSLGTIGTTDKLYAVGVDSNGKLAVNVPWEANTDEKVAIRNFTTGNLYFAGTSEAGTSSGTTLLSSSGFRLNKSSNTYKLIIGSGSSNDLGQVSLSRGIYNAIVRPSSSQNSDITLYLPDANGTIALTSDIPDVSGFITSETDPTVPAWAKESTKPSYTASEVGAQPTLVSGTNIKTVNNESLLGSGNIEIQGGGEHVELTQAEYDALSQAEKENGTVYYIPDGQPENYIVNDSVPIGAIQAYGGETAPAGWLICDGSTVSRTGYSELFSAIGTAFGEGDGSTTFNLPDLRGRTAIGSGLGTDRDAVERTLGQTGGHERVTLTTEQIPSHSHGYQKPVLMWGSGANAAWPGSGTTAKGSDQWGYSGVANTGGGESHDNMQPYIVTNYIIKAKDHSITHPDLLPMLDMIYPVGCYFETSDNSFNPNVSIGGAWTLEVGETYTADWTATSSNANNVQVTNSLTLDAGTYLISVKSPVCSQDSCFFGLYPFGLTYSSIFFNQDIRTYTISVTQSTTIFVVTNMSTATNYSYIDRGYLKASRLIYDGVYKWHRIA